MINILEKVKEFFYKLIGKDKTLALEAPKVEEKNEDTQRNVFKENISINNNIISIQKLYEDGKVKEEDLSVEEVFDLVSVYKEQIEKLDSEIAKMKAS